MKIGDVRTFLTEFIILTSPNKNDFLSVMDRELENVGLNIKICKLWVAVASDTASSGWEKINKPFEKNGTIAYYFGNDYLIYMWSKNCNFNSHRQQVIRIVLVVSSIIDVKCFDDHCICCKTLK